MCKFIKGDWYSLIRPPAFWGACAASLFFTLLPLSHAVTLGSVIPLAGSIFLPSMS